MEEMQTFSFQMCHIQGARDLCEGRAEPSSALEGGLGPGRRTGPGREIWAREGGLGPGGRSGLRCTDTPGFSLSARGPLGSVDFSDGPQEPAPADPVLLESRWPDAAWNAHTVSSGQRKRQALQAPECQCQCEG